MTRKRILVTGATGFLGSAIVSQAVQAGLAVTATYRSACPQVTGVDFVPADILDKVSLSKVFENVDSVCHAAGVVRLRTGARDIPFNAVNVVGAENVVRAACNAGVKTFVFISSVAVYGSLAQGHDEGASCHPEGPYAESKLQAEHRLAAFCQEEGMSLTILRLATLYGAGDLGNVAQLVGAIDRHRFIWIGQGRNFKSLLHRKDAARACIAALNNPRHGINTYNLSAPPCTMRDIVDTIALALKRRVASWYVPASVALAAAKTVDRLAGRRSRLNGYHATIRKWLADDYYDSNKFCQTFNYVTELTLEQGIQDEVVWYRAGSKG